MQIQEGYPFIYFQEELQKGKRFALVVMFNIIIQVTVNIKFIINI